jgi:hypothetical protein
MFGAAALRDIRDAPLMKARCYLWFRLSTVRERNPSVAKDDEAMLVSLRSVEASSGKLFHQRTTRNRPGREIQIGSIRKTRLLKMKYILQIR